MPKPQRPGIPQGTAVPAAVLAAAARVPVRETVSVPEVPAGSRTETAGGTGMQMVPIR